MIDASRRFEASEAQYLEIYRALRAEILYFYQRRSQHLAVRWAALSGLIAASALAELPDLCVLALLVAASGWIDDLQNTQSILRASMFIELNVEAVLPGIRWEGYVHRVYTAPAGKPSFSVARACYSNYGIATLISVVAEFLLLNRWPPAEPVRWILVCSLTALGIGLVVVALRKTMGLPAFQQDVVNSLVGAGQNEPAAGRRGSGSLG